MPQIATGGVARILWRFAVALAEDRCARRDRVAVWRALSPRVYIGASLRRVAAKPSRNFY
jgi:hypothetical protein